MRARPRGATHGRTGPGARRSRRPLHSPKGRFFSMAVAVSPYVEVVVPSFSLVGKKALVTGASRGIGRACAVTLAAAGAEVAVGSSPFGAEFAARVCAEIKEMGRRAEAYSCDVSVPSDVERMCERVAHDFDGIDILVNNAGITRDASFRKMSSK